MAVNPDRVNQLLSDFQSKVEGLVRSSGLEHHMGTGNLAEVDTIRDDTVERTMTMFTLPHVTEGELKSEMNVAIVSIKRALAEKSRAEANQLAGFGSTVMRHSAADSALWNGVIADTAHRIDQITKMYGEQIQNMPKALRDRIDSDFSRVLDSINDSFNMDPSPSNAKNVSVQAATALDKIEKDLKEAANALLKASIEHIAETKMTELQQLQIALSSAEPGMTRGQIEQYRKIIEDVRNLILELGKSNYLVYDKIVRNQKISVIDQKMAVLDNLRVNATGVEQALSGYFGNTGFKRAKQISSPIGGVGVSLGMPSAPISNPRKNFKNGIPPGFAGFAGSMTKDDIAQKHPANTAKAHIDAMHHYMESEGLDFEAAHNKASASGYTPEDHSKVFSIGGGRHPFW